MNKDMKKLMVPTLRFPEFRDAEGWAVKEVGEVFDVTRGYVLSMGLVKDKSSIEMPFPVYSSQTKNNGLAGFYSDFLYENAITWTTDGANAGDVNYRAGKFYCTNVCGVLINKDGYANPCVAALINSVSKQYVSYVGNPKLMNGVMAKIVLPFPTVNEQQKIASCLSSIDELITAQSQKVEALKTHKKALMQQLFPTDGETVPRLRFPEFLEAGEWEEKPLKKVFSIFQGFAFSSNDSVPHGVRWLKIADVSIQQMNHGAPSYLPIDHVEQYQKFSVYKGDYVLALTRPILSGELKMAPVDDLFHGALLNQRVGKLVTDQNISFIYYLLQTSKLISNIDNSISGSEPPNLSAQQIEDLKTCIPLVDEQQKIASCLSSIDELINAQSQKVDALKTHKKGLMQQLFPAAEAANAEAVA